MWGVPSWCSLGVPALWWMSILYQASWGMVWFPWKCGWCHSIDSWGWRLPSSDHEEPSWGLTMRECDRLYKCLADPNAILDPRLWPRSAKSSTAGGCRSASGASLDGPGPSTKLWRGGESQPSSQVILVELEISGGSMVSSTSTGSATRGTLTDFDC